MLYEKKIKSIAKMLRYYYRSVNLGTMKAISRCNRLVQVMEVFEYDTHFVYRSGQHVIVVNIASLTSRLILDGIDTYEEHIAALSEDEIRENTNVVYKFDSIPEASSFYNSFCIVVHGEEYMPANGFLVSPKEAASQEIVALAREAIMECFSMIENACCAANGFITEELDNRFGIADVEVKSNKGISSESATVI